MASFDEALVVGLNLREKIDTTQYFSHSLCLEILYRPYRGTTGLSSHQVFVERSELRIFDASPTKHPRDERLALITQLLSSWGFVKLRPVLSPTGRRLGMMMGLTSCNVSSWNSPPTLGSDEGGYENAGDDTQGEVPTFALSYNYSESVKKVGARFRSMVADLLKHNLVLDNRGSVKCLMDLVDTDFFHSRMAHPRVLEHTKHVTDLKILLLVSDLKAQWALVDTQHPNIWFRLRTAVVSLDLPCVCEGNRCKFLVGGFKEGAALALCDHYDFLIHGMNKGQKPSDAFTAEMKRLLTPPLVNLRGDECKPTDTVRKAPADIVFLTSSNDKLLKHALSAVESGAHAGQQQQTPAIYVDYSAVRTLFLNTPWSWWLHDEPSADDLSTIMQIGTELALDLKINLQEVLAHSSRTSLATILMSRLLEDADILSPWVRIRSDATTHATKRALETPETLAVLPDLTTADVSIKKGGGYQGGLVLPANPGFFDSTHLVDFDSHYPSIMADYDIFYRCFGHRVAERGRRAFEARVRELIQKKRASKEEGKPAMGLACKLRCNILYGCFGRQGLPMASLAMAGDITARGRELLHSVVQLATTFLPGASVLMGHTDAVLLSNTSSLPEGMTYAQGLDNLCSEINANRETIFLDQKDVYQWSWVLNKTRHVSLCKGQTALAMLHELNATIEEAWTNGTRQDRLASVTKRLGAWAKFPGLINASMPGAANLLTLVGMLAIAIQWAYDHETPAPDAVYTEQFLAAFRALHTTLEEAMQFLPGWIHWVSPSEDQNAPAVKNDMTYRRTLFAESPHHRHQQIIPVIRSSSTHAFERPAITFNSIADVDHPWWRKRVFDTLVRNLDNTPGAPAPFKANMARLLRTLLQISSSTVAAVDEDGEGGEKASPAADLSFLETANRRQRFTSYWDQMMAESDGCGALWASLPDATAAASWYINGKSYPPLAVDAAKANAQLLFVDHLTPYMESLVAASEWDDFRDFVTSKLLGRFELPRALSQVYTRRADVEAALAKLQTTGTLAAFRTIHAEMLALITACWFDDQEEKGDDEEEEEEEEEEEAEMSDI